MVLKSSGCHLRWHNGNLHAVREGVAPGLATGRMFNGGLMATPLGVTAPAPSVEVPGLTPVHCSFTAA